MVLVVPVGIEPTLVLSHIPVMSRVLYRLSYGTVVCYPVSDGTDTSAPKGRRSLH